MSIASLFQPDHTVLSFEVFPPKRTSSIQTIYSTLDELKDLRPDFISVTYGAGGNLADNSTCEIASIIQNKYGIQALAHLTCVNGSKEDIRTMLGRFREQGIHNILALRGDKNPDLPPKTDFMGSGSVPA